MQHAIVTPLVLGFIALFVVLTLASTITAALVRMYPEKSFVELKLRIQTWWGLVGILLLALSVDHKFALAIFAIVTFLAFREFLSIIPTRKGDHCVLLLAYALIPLQYTWVALGSNQLFLTFIPLWTMLAVPLHLVLLGEPKGFLFSAGTLQWGLMTIVFGISHAARLLSLPDAVDRQASGEMLVFYLLVLTQVNDVAQYLWGKACGKRQAAPRVSPNKSVEGLLGGVVTTTLLAWMLAPSFTPMNDLHASVSGLLIAGSGFVGDIVISAVKRDVGVKDSGRLLPGHGGMLDRLDSLTFTAPVFFYYVRYFYY